MIFKERNAAQTEQQTIAFKLRKIPKYRCVGPVQQDPVNHVRRETEQH